MYIAYSGWEVAGSYGADANRREKRGFLGLAGGVEKKQAVAGPMGADGTGHPNRAVLLSIDPAGFSLLSRIVQQVESKLLNKLEECAVVCLCWCRCGGLSG